MAAARGQQSDTSSNNGNITSENNDSKTQPPPTLEQSARPTLQSHLSSSVPSTPYQQPHDRRFQSRSPSPRRGLGSHSPRSVVSEAIGASAPNGVLRPIPATPVVCKFETAPEFRKRRVPYIEDGDKELAPPEKKPKASLEPYEEDKLSGDMRELYDRLLPSKQSECNRAELIKKLERIFADEWPDSDIKVSVFGSSGNLLSSSDSDVDVCITTTLKKVESMHTLATLLDKHGMERVVCRAAAKVPIVKCWDPVLQLACDVNVNNPLALENTRMIKTYVQLDSRVRPLAKVIKHWTKQRILNDAAFGGTISSYTWICMIISFLQLREPPILPSLQRTPGHRSVVNGNESEFADDLEALSPSGEANKESMAALLFHFFRYYGYEFEYSKQIVSVKEGKSVTRKEKGWDNYRDNKEARCRLCVEEPFNTSRNLGNSADDYAWSGIHGEIRRAFELLADGAQLDKCCEQYEFPIEEKSIFVRPQPRPKPTLTRSASQSGARPSHDGSQPRSRKNSNRNPSSHRSSNRRASSGAVFGNQRGPLMQSPQLGGVSAMDYFAKQGNLHDHLIQQYQYLQVQRDVLTSQLVMREQQQHAQQQQQQQQSSGQAQSTGGSPHLRGHAFANGRIMDGAPQTAPLLPGSLYHFTARYPPLSPALTQQLPRTRDGSVTNPSSPLLPNAAPAQLRQGNRATVSEGSNSSIRSQSQPGRSLPHPITLQQQVHPGYDVSGALGQAYHNVRASSYIPHALASAGYPFPFPQMPQYTAGLPGIDPTMPREYVGYYVGQSPQLAPQYAAANIPIPPVPTLSSPPQTRQRRDTPELMPPLDRKSSRSPSPLGNARSPATSSLAPEAEPPSLPPLEPGEPIIVNGSTPSKPRDRSTGAVIANAPKINGENALGLDIQQTIQQLPIRALPREEVAISAVMSEHDRAAPINSAKSSTRTSPHLSLSPSSTPQNGLLHDASHTTILPLLSPVAELRTPSPTLSTRTDLKDWPQSNGISRAAVPTSAPADAKFAKAASMLTPTEAKHIRQGSAPQLDTAVSKASRSPTLPLPLSAGLSPQDKNPWQQATGKKGHKKKNSIAYAASVQRSPVIEGERKGG